MGDRHHTVRLRLGTLHQMVPDVLDRSSGTHLHNRIPGSDPSSARDEHAQSFQRGDALEIVKRASTTPFLVKLWQMLADDENHEVIAWDKNGVNFEVKRPDDMAKRLLPKHFRHNNYSSFQRQLNYFGFRKVGKGEHGGLYMHEHFLKHRPEEVLRIKRKTNLKANSALDSTHPGVKAAAQLMNDLKVKADTNSPRHRNRAPFAQILSANKRRRSCSSDSNQIGGALTEQFTASHTLLSLGTQAPDASSPCLSEESESKPEIRYRFHSRTHGQHVALDNLKDVTTGSPRYYDARDCPSDGSCGSESSVNSDGSPLSPSIGAMQTQIRHSPKSNQEDTQGGQSEAIEALKRLCGSTAEDTFPYLSNVGIRPSLVCGAKDLVVANEKHPPLHTDTPEISLATPEIPEMTKQELLEAYHACVSQQQSLESMLQKERHRVECLQKTVHQQQLAQEKWHHEREALLSKLMRAEKKESCNDYPSQDNTTA